jgi:hypothetical protein
MFLVNIGPRNILESYVSDFDILELTKHSIQYVATNER